MKTQLMLFFRCNHIMAKNLYAFLEINEKETINIFIHFLSQINLNILLKNSLTFLQRLD